MTARILARLATFAVALLVAIALPVGTLRIEGVDDDCCCPTRSKCKCPHDEAPPESPTQMKPCHKTQQAFAAPVLSAFVLAPQLARLSAPTQAVPHRLPPLATPHRAPAPPRPDAPS